MIEVGLLLYEIVSGCVTSLLKPGLDKIVKPSQMAHLPGKYIGEITRNVYDIFQHAHKHYKASSSSSLLTSPKSSTASAMIISSQSLNSLSTAIHYITLIELFGL